MYNGSKTVKSFLLRSRHFLDIGIQELPTTPQIGQD